MSDAMTQRGGAERVVEALAELFPDAPIFATLYCPQRGPRSLKSRVQASFLGAMPGARAHHRWYFPLFPLAVESFDLSRYDIIISSHHCAAKGVLRNGGQTHICYCHTPMRALWERTHDDVGILPGPMRFGADILLSRIRQWDYITASRVDCFIANSRETQKRIAKHYGRESLVVNPPIDVEHFTAGGEVGDYYLVASRPVPYKRIDIAVGAARQLRRRLIVVGGGRECQEPNDVVQYLGHVSDHRLVELMRGARALIAPQHEDFGMAILEANACGRPVIAFARGGALETVIDGKTGLLVEEQSVGAFADAIEQAERMTFDTHAVRRHAERFSKHAFMRAFESAVYAAYEGSNEREQRQYPRLALEAGVLAK
ncbi:MAG TPA: glycosyltransferase [Candidatus Limnocylindria bacterium]|nr:glycosyltransferase [Candidatus Limnocylindria bacterium]